MHIRNVLEKSFPEIRHTYTERDTMLYGLSVGSCQDPLSKDDLTFVFESRLQALPSMISVLSHPGMWVKEPELEIDWKKLVHAEQRIQVRHTLPPAGTVIGTYRIGSIVDKGGGQGAMLTLDKMLCLEDSTLIGTVSSTYLLRGDGGSGHHGEAPRALLPSPTAPADGHIDVPVSPTAALLYRLNGDYNPLHADPAVASLAGFDRPILHGLCTYGIACQSLVKAACSNDTTRMLSMAARFTKPVYPGETLRTEWWNTDAGRLLFRTTSIERNLVVLDRGEATIRGCA